MTINTDRLAAQLRAPMIDVERKAVRLSRIAGSEQEEDLSVPPNAEGYGRIRHFRRTRSQGWPDNPLPIDPVRASLGMPSGDDLEAQVFQSAGCDWRCWYCFVPYSLLRADPKSSRLVSVQQMIDWYLSVANRPRLIDLSGGEPSLTPEWSIWLIDELERRGLADSTYVWTDDNLSVDYLWRYTSDQERRRLREFPHFGHVACFKGFDETSFAFNTAAAPDDFAKQLALFERLRDLGTDLYAYITLTTPEQDERRIQLEVCRFLDRLQAIAGNLPLRTIPLEITAFRPVAGRLDAHSRFAMERGQHIAIAAWLKEIERRFSPALRMTPIHVLPWNGAP